MPLVARLQQQPVPTAGTDGSKATLVHRHPSGKYPFPNKMPTDLTREFLQQVRRFELSMLADR